MAPVHILMMINGIDKTRKTFAMILDGVTQSQAETLRDGPDGWSILEIMCHLRDYQDIYRERIDAMLEQDKPTFKAYDRFALIEQNNYPGQDLTAVLAAYSAARDRFMTLLNGLDDVQWQLPGLYPDDSESSVFNIALQLLAHDNDHIEQVLRILSTAEK